MEQNGTPGEKTPPWEWDTKRTEAAVFIAEGRLSDVRIAQRVGVGRTTLHRWGQITAFQERVRELRAQFLADAYEIGIADKRARLKQLDDKARRIESTIDSRAERAARLLEQSDEHVTIPAPSGMLRSIDDDDKDDDNEPPPEEALTGLLVCVKKVIGTGEVAETIVEWRVDTPLLRELRETLKAAAIEMGEWDEAPSKGMENGRGKMFGTAVVQVIKREVVREPADTTDGGEGK